VLYQTAGLKETLLFRPPSRPRYGRLAELFCVAFVAVLSDIWGFRSSFFFFFGRLMYLFDLCGKAACLGFSSTTNVRLKIILFALKSLDVPNSIMFLRNQNKNKRQTSKQTHPCNNDKQQRDLALLLQSGDRAQRERHFLNKTAT